ncbi:MAG TPA: MFS transporter [Candidatus Saccharimonadales bacterium]|nr:MFS transporter [Candidatus Saccharimonadales bacterium]
MKQHSKWIILALLAVVMFMVVLDSAIANVALPAIQQSLGFSSSALQWVITVYALTFGGTLLLGGRAADLFGRRRVLIGGIIAFTISSLFIGIANTPVEMIAFRAIQGVAAAFMSPSALSIVLTTFREGNDRNKAIGIWSTVAAGGAAVGLVLGGILTEYLNWRWNFFINIPIGILTIWGIMKVVPKHSSTASHRHLDLRGAALVTSGLMALVYGLTEASNWGWLSPATLGMLALSVLLIVGFVWNESKVAHPLVPLSIFKIRNVSGANLMVIPLMAGMMGMFFLLSLYMQMVMRYDPVKTGLAFIIFPIIIGIVSNIVPRFIGKLGFKRFLVIGSSLLILGLAWLSTISQTSNYFTTILPAIVLMAGGMGMSFVAVTIAATSGVHADQAGLASGLLNVSQQMGGALGLAILSGVATGVTEASAHLGAAGSVVQGDKVAFMVATLFGVFALILAITVIRTPKQTTKAAVTEPVVVH